MTIINEIQIDNIRYINNPIKNTIINNTKIEENLHVIIVVSNPCQFAKRYILAKESIYRLEKELNVILYVVELIYKNQNFVLTNKTNKRHLQLQTDTEPLWNKENMINIGVRKLLPDNWKAFAWVDADIEFENTSWALDTLKILNGDKDIVQLFSHSLDMDNDDDIMNIWTSFGFQYMKGRKYSKKNSGVNQWHPGYAWAITRKAYESIGGLYELSILGSGDHNMALSLLGHAKLSVNMDVSDDYKQSVIDYQTQIQQLRLGYTPGVIRHYYHGSKVNRKYTDRWKILVNHKYSPSEHILRNNDGLIIPSNNCPKELLADIKNYFFERNEDE
jgi:hypothetical protein